jgi:integrase
MASLQARHGRACTLKRPWTTYANALKGCTCTPLYHVVFRVSGKLVREPVGHNRKEAKRALDAIRGDLARKRYKAVQDVPFDQWADQWLASLRTAGRKESYARTLAGTLETAKRVFGKTKVRELDTSDVQRFLEHATREHERRQKRRKPEQRKPISQATLAKHLRQLGSCLSAAVAEGYAADNPVSRIHSSRRPRAQRPLPAYFTNAELARLWPELDERPAYKALCQLAATTGMRSGELIALRWSDIELFDREVTVSRTYVAGIGETTPKSGKGRTIDLTPQAFGVLENWWEATGDPGDSDGLVFEKESGGHLDAGYVLDHVLYPAMERAGIPRVGEHGRARTFHSFRHTFARAALEGGAPIVWVKEQLGHSSIDLTVTTYGRWERSSQKAQANALAGAFAV